MNKIASYFVSKINWQKIKKLVINRADDKYHIEIVLKKDLSESKILIDEDLYELMKLYEGYTISLDTDSPINVQIFIQGKTVVRNLD